MAQPELADVEIVAEMFQLARTGLFHSQEGLLEQAQKQFPSETPERLRDCSRQLGELLKKTNHGGYADEYARQRRPRKAKAVVSNAQANA